MKTIRRSQDRGHANHGWLDSYHTFSFADYRDSRFMGFRSLRVINEDVVAGGGGFDMHPHRDMEIITYVLSGALQHRDSMGHSEVLKPGEVQRISAGTGIEHSEFNYSPIEPVHLLQIWLFPDKRGHKPGYAQKSFASQIRPGALTLVASPDGADGSITINQDTRLHVGKLNAADSLEYPVQPGRHVWLQVAKGAVALDGDVLKAGDAAAISDEARVKLTGQEPSEFLLFDLN